MLNEKHGIQLNMDNRIFVYYSSMASELLNLGVLFGKRGTPQTKLTLLTQNKAALNLKRPQPTEYNSVLICQCLTISLFSLSIIRFLKYHAKFTPSKLDFANPYIITYSFYCHVQACMPVIELETNSH